NDKLGNSPNKPNYLTSSSTRNGIAAGIAPPAGGSPGVNVVGGNVTTALEDPTGAPPQNATTPEAAAPTVLPGGPGTPPPLLEDPHGGVPAAPTGWHRNPPTRPAPRHMTASIPRLLRLAPHTG